MIAHAPLYRRAAALAAVSLVVALHATPTFAAFRKNPYLVYRGDPTTMQVLWQATASVSSTIDWGQDTSYSLGTAQAPEYGTAQHAYTITGLTPGERYLYRVNCGGTIYAGSFRAAPPVGTPQLKFFAYGDTRTNVSMHNAIAAQMMNAVTADSSRQTLILSVGDIVNNGDSESDWDSQFFSGSYPALRKMTGNFPYQACMGNHEGTGVLFQKYFPYPFVGHRYWSFDYGPAHIVVVDQYADYTPGSDQLTWIANDLAATTQPWRFLLLHEPGWTAGGDHPNNTSVQQYLQPLCVQYGVAIVFGGHNHYYARAVVDGVTHLTIGGGGAPLYAPVLPSPDVVTATESYHYCRITIDAWHLGFAAVLGTAVLDTFAIDRPTAVDPSRTPTPVVLEEARPNPFNPATTLAFSLATPQRVRLAVYDVAGRRVGTRRAGTGRTRPAASFPRGPTSPGSRPAARRPRRSSCWSVSAALDRARASSKL
jgi:hypothetical protein